MNAREALSTVSDQLDDLQSFAETFDAEDWGDDDAEDQEREDQEREDLEATGRFGSETVAHGDEALRLLAEVVDAAEAVLRAEVARGFIIPDPSRKLAELLGVDVTS